MKQKISTLNYTLWTIILLFGVSTASVAQTGNSGKTALEECEERYQTAAQQAEALELEIERLQDMLRMQQMNSNNAPSPQTQAPATYSLPNQVAATNTNATPPASNTNSGDYSYSDLLSSGDRNSAAQLRIAIDSIIRNKIPTMALPLRFFGTNAFHTFVVDLKSDQIVTNFFWKDQTRRPYRNLYNLRLQTERSGRYGEMLFATNGGMYDQYQSPKGLLTIDGQEITPLDMQRNGFGNFYLQPNGVFLIQNDGTPKVVPTVEYYKYRNNTRVATQSGPMLIIDGQINPKFNHQSRNSHVRSGVGIINDRYVVFIRTYYPATFFEIAVIFKEAFGCQNALFLDGTISKVYCSEPSMQLDERDGFFSTMIGIYTRP